MRILVAEDNPVNQILAVRILKKWGHDIRVVENGEEAVAAVCREQFDLVLMDVQMPEMGGFEATARIRSQEQTTGHHIPIIAMTARALAGDREGCLAAGMDGYVTKPLQLDDLWKALADCLPSVRPAQSASLPAGAADGILDFEAFLARVGGDRELLREVVELFLHHAPEQVTAVRDAIRRQDAAALEFSAHALKGSVGNFSARTSWELADRLETMAREDHLTQATECFESLLRALDRLMDALKKLTRQVQR